MPGGSTVWRGSVTAREKAVFTNRLADFAVRKTLTETDGDSEGHTADDSFRFCLTDKDGAPYAGASYYLAARDGSLVNSEVLYTDTQGHFSLKAGQTAVFCGMSEGSRYSIREEKMMGYRQVMPDSEDGFVDQLVKSGVPELVFENEKTSVKLPVPSAGGTGIMIILAFAAVGMFLSAVFLSGNRVHLAGGLLLKLRKLLCGQ